MSAICFEGPSRNPEIQEAAYRTFEVLRIATFRAVDAVGKVPTVKLPQDPNSIERDAFKFFEKYEQFNRQGVKELSQRSRSRLPVSARLPAGLSGLQFSFASQQSVVQQALGKQIFKGIKFSSATVAQLRWDKAAGKFKNPPNSDEMVRRLLLSIKPKLLGSGPVIGTPGGAGPSGAKELRLRLQRLQAVQRFGWEPTDWGNDNIAAGGDGFDSTLDHRKVNSFDIHQFSADGETFTINPASTFVRFDLARPGLWPRSFMANVFLAEKDASGGFIEFLQALWDKIGPEVIAAASALAVAAAGAIAGAIAGTELAPVAGTIIGAIVGAAIALFVMWLMDSLKDDIFESGENPLGVVLEDQNALFAGGSKTSPVYVHESRLGPARYLLHYYWELV